MFKLHNGDQAPSIALKSAQGNDWNLEEYRGKMVILLFGRGVYCPTTRGDFCFWNSYNHIFGWMNCHLAFIVNGGQKEHAQFAENNKLRPPILIDHDGAVGDAYGVYGVNHDDMDRDDYKNYIAPSCYLIDTEGKVSAFWLLSGPRGLPTPETLLGMLGYAQHYDWKY